MEVIYTKSQYEPTFRSDFFVTRDGASRSVWTNRGKFQISLLESYRKAVIVDTLGNIISDELQVMFHGYWSWTSVMANLLPLDFNPELDFNPVKKQHQKATGIVTDSIRRIFNMPSFTAHQILLQRGRRLQRAGDYLGAITFFNKAIDAAPDNPENYITRASLRTAQNDYARAVADFSKAILLQPKNVPLYVRRGLAKLSLSEYTDAEKDFTEAIIIDSLTYDAYFYRGFTRHKQARYDVALSDFIRSQSILPTDAAYIWSGKTAARLKNYDLAKQYFTKSLLLNPENAEAYYERSKVNQQIGDNAAMYLDMLKARRLGSASAQTFLSDYEKQGGDTLKIYQSKEIIVEANSIEVQRKIESAKLVVDISKYVVGRERLRSQSVFAPSGFGGEYYNNNSFPPLYVSEWNCNKKMAQYTKSTQIFAVGNIRNSVLCIAKLFKEEAVILKDNRLIEISHAIENLAVMLANTQDDLASDIIGVGIKPTLIARKTAQLGELDNLIYKFQERLDEQQKRVQQ
jgi:tetratricopeptide (TPR) repeat protein